MACYRFRLARGATENAASPGLGDEAWKRIAGAEDAGAPILRGGGQLLPAVVSMLGGFLADRESDQPRLVVVVKEKTALLLFIYRVCLAIRSDKILRSHNDSMVKFSVPGASLCALLSSDRRHLC